MKLRFAVLSAILVVSAGAYDKLSLMAPPTPVPMPANVGAFFGRQQDLEAAVVTAINQAKTEILVNQMAITNPRIAYAIVDAFAKRHVAVGIILDPDPPVINYKGFDFLKNNEIPFLLAKTSPQGGRNNHKYAVIDRRVVLVGSYDWMVSSNKNNEDIVVIDEPGVACKFVEHWLEEAKLSTIPPSVLNTKKP